MADKGMTIRVREGGRKIVKPADEGKGTKEEKVKKSSDEPEPKPVRDRALDKK